MQTSRTGLDFIKGFESFVPYVYDDLVPAKKGVYREWKKGDPVKGTLTIGWGHTDAARYAIGFKLKDVPPNFRISKETADEILSVDLSESEEDVARLVKNPLTQGQWDGCVSFCFNCGSGNFANIAKRINAGNYSSARAAFDLYVKSKGQTLRGLQRRRDGEQVLWDSDIPTIPTDVVDHPADVDQPQKPATKDLVTVSRKAKWLVWIDRTLKFIAGLFTLDTVLSALNIAQDVVGKVKGFVSEEANVIIISGAILGSLAIAYVISLMREDVEEGRATPSGETA